LIKIYDENEESKMAVTIKELSRHCNVSIATISQVLNGVGRPGEDTKRRVLETAQRLGYRPNRYAKAMKSGKFGAINLLLSSQVGRSDLPKELFNGIVDYLMEHDVHLCVAKLPDTALTNESEIPKILTEWMCDGMIVNYHTQIPEKMVKIVKESRIPAIWVNSDRFNTDSVYYDEYGGGVRATEHLLKLGHSRIAFVDLVEVWDQGDSHYSGTARRHGYIDTMIKAGFSPRPIGGTVKLTREKRITYSRDVLCREDRPTAIIASSTSSAVALEIAAASLQIQIPRDLSIITFGDSGFLSITNNFFSTFITPEYEAGREAAKMVMEKIERPEEEISSRVLELNLSPGATICEVSSKM
jgi:LacI family transcriptional regulator